MNQRWLFPLASAVFLAGCGIGLKPEGIPPRPESVTGILFRTPPERLSSRGAGLDAKALAQTVSRNLDAWGFPVTADAEPPHTHVMEPEVGEVRDGSTPTGFSFSPGNSDPRAPDFQKADVVTVTCTLRGTVRGHENAYLKEGFVADEVMKKGGKALFETYANHIGTACFNLLTELKIKRSKPDPEQKSGTASSTWFPEVRIETRDEPAGAAAAPEDATTPAEIPGIEAKDKERVGPASKAEAREVQAPSVQTEVKEGETRRQMVIHNQGSPIILEFGYDRK